MEKLYNPNELIINKTNIKKNIKSIKKFIGPSIEIMPVIKANAYGIGMKNIIPILNEENIRNIGVATVEEAIELRKYFDGQILILLQPMKQQIKQIIKSDIVVNVCDFGFIYELNEQSRNSNKVSKIHIEIDTGMGRTGISFDEINEFLDKVLKLSNVKIIGVSSHLSSSGFDEKYSLNQINIFKKAIDKISKKIDLKYIHIFASGGILKYPIKYSNMVRTGIMLYGYYPNDCKNIKLYPALTLKSRISYIHDVKNGDSIGYNRIYRANKHMRLAVIPLGFADAFMGLESNVGHVFIHGCKAKIIAICMDTMMIDITDIKHTNIGDEVILWDNKNILLEQWGDWTNTSNYEVLSILSNRIDRIIK